MNINCYHISIRSGLGNRPSKMEVWDWISDLMAFEYIDEIIANGKWGI